ncbi:MAG: methionyl-tRNA formyltransferase, partial [Halioglobus sp.]|nr:methionyl-tRNA formyltransferase [Halioglobus sp.]
GTPAFARASLAALVASGLRPVAVYTQPDRPSGRGRKLAASPVKEYAEESGLPIVQPASLKPVDVQRELATFGADIIIVAAYGLIFPQTVLDIPRLGCINVHASLLPRWRGAAPVQAAILAGDTQTGISLMQMEAGLDSGPVFATAAIDILADETAGELHDRLAALGGELLVDRLASIVDGTLRAVPQDDAYATSAGKIETSDSVLNWQLPAIDLARAVRAYAPVPGARFMLGDELVKCWRASVLDGVPAAAGTVVAAGRDGIDVACGSGILRLHEVQRAGRRRISAAELAAQLALTGITLPVNAVTG